MADKAERPVSSSHPSGSSASRRGCGGIVGHWEGEEGPGEGEGEEEGPGEGEEDVPDRGAEEEVPVNREPGVKHDQGGFFSFSQRKI